mmetsp:Transcript_14887/g.20863  ORF Transcript_14887/g.20863 Transcript_14887/m.20863 type:complete len:139 (-) Transcript_14887:165-581(-)
MRVAVKESQHGKHETLKDELKVCIQLHHENLVRVYGGYSAGEKPFIVMELCELGSLHDVIKKVTSQECIESCSINKHNRLLWSKQLAAGLAYLHGNKVRHNDIKSSNVLITAFGVAKWCDFNISTVKRPFARHLNAPN